MNNQNPSSLESSNGTASAGRQPMTGPGDGRATDNDLHNVELEARGEFLNDNQRDRDSKGVQDGYDDSLQRRKGDSDGHDYLGIARGD